MLREKARPKDAWVWSEEGEGMPQKREDIGDFRRGVWFGIRRGIFVEHKTIANGGVDVCCNKDKNRKREDED